eukprot:3416510-Rhodomonas_salina.3
MLLRGSRTDVWYGATRLSRDASVTQKYIISTYFTCTVFTTVGFGDISASNSSGQLAWMPV